MPHAHGADQSDAFAVPQLLPEELPAHPLELFARWWREAHERNVQPNPNSMCLATIDGDGNPSARIVLCKAMDLDPEGGGYLVFYSNRQSRKGVALAADPRAAATFHWDTLDRQVRIEGLAVQSPDAESDAYFASRPLESRIGAWASDQSRPIGSRGELMIKVFDTLQRLGVALDDESAVIPRPAHWGGYRLWIRAMELWVGGPGRVHDRARWDRTLARSGDGFRPGPWSVTRLQP